MSLFIQRSVVEQFNFNGKNVRSVYVKDVGQCLVSRDVYKAVGYDMENGKKANSKFEFQRSTSCDMET